MSIIVFEHGEQTGSGRLGRTLRDHGHLLRIVRPDLGEPMPPDLDNVDGVVTCGGPQSANDRAPWIAAEMEYLRAANNESLPIVGLCLGCQLLGKALGGEVGRLDSIELGWHDVTVSDVGREDVLHAGVAWSSAQLHWHREHVSKVPPGARVLARSQRCPVQAWTLGLRTYAFQYHPEADIETIEAWAADEPGDLKEAGISLDELRRQTALHYPAFERLSQRLFENIALLLMPVERRYKGLVKDLHH